MNLGGAAAVVPLVFPTTFAWVVMRGFKLVPPLDALVKKWTAFVDQNLPFYRAA